MSPEPRPVGALPLLPQMPDHVRELIASGGLPEHQWERTETPEQLAERRETAHRFRRAKWERRLPSTYASASLADLTADQNPRGDVTGWWESGHQTLLLYSPTPGNGKTHALYAVGNRAVAAGAWAEGWTSIEFLSAMRPEGDPDALHNAITCDLLCLDDLGRENDTAWTREQLQHVLNARVSDGRRQVVTTNLSDDTMSLRYSAPLIDRLVDDAVIVKVEGESRRRPARW